MGAGRCMLAHMYRWEGQCSSQCRAKWPAFALIKLVSFIRACSFVRTNPDSDPEPVLLRPDIAGVISDAEELLFVWV